MTPDEIAEQLEDHEVRLRAAESSAPTASQRAPLDPATIDRERLVEFVVGLLLPCYPRQPTRWCSRWLDHHEAVIRLEGLRRAWDELSGTPLGLSTWHRDHLDPCLAQLLALDGPFAGCTIVNGVRHDPLDPLPTEGT